MFNNGLPERNMIYFFHNNQNKKVKKYKVDLYIRVLTIGIIQFFCWSNISGQVIDYSDTGNGIHQNKIQWLTWAGTDLDDGIHNGDSVNFSLPLGGNLEVVFSNVSIAYPIPDPTPGDGESPHGYLPSDVYTWCGATFYTAYDLSSSGSEILFSDIDNSGVVGNGENAQDINFDISFKLIINGNTLPADIIVGDPETTNPGYSETITVSSNRGDWELIENIRGTNYGLSGLNTNVIIISDTETGFGCSGGTSTGTNSSPLLMTTGVVGIKTQLNYDISFPIDLGHEGIVFGIKLPFDQGDAPSSYQVASHLQEMIPTTIGSPDLINNSKLYLGAIPGDADYHVNNALFSSGANGDNNDNINDEDGLITTNYEESCDGTILEIPNSEINIVNITGSTAKIHAWIDFDQNGIFDAGEYAVADVLNGTTNPQSDLVFSLPSGFVTGSKYMRLRLSTDSAVDGLTPFGVAVDGEVEDYVVTISDPIVCEEICNNGIDDDGDGDIDLADLDCLCGDNLTNPIWMVDEETGADNLSLWSFTDYGDANTGVNYGRLNYFDPSTSTIRDVDDAKDMEALAVNPYTGIGYFFSSSKANNGPSNSQALFKYDLNEAANNSGNIILTLIGHITRPSSHAMEALAYHPSSNRFYTSDPKDGDGNASTTVDDLYYIDLNNLNPDPMVATNAVLIGPIAGAGEINNYVDGLEFDDSGNLYAIDGSDDHLYLINPSTGAIISVVDNDLPGGTGHSGIDIETIAWDSRTQKMIGIDNDHNEIVELDLTQNGNNTVLMDYLSTAGMPSDADFEGSAMFDACLPKMSIGNLVFEDIDNNNVFTSGEGIDGVKVELYQSTANVATSTPIETTFTSGGGLYVFENLIEGDYFIHIPSSEFGVGEPLEFLISINGAGGDSGIDNNDDGVDVADPTLTGVSSAVVSLNENTEPINSSTENGLGNTNDDLDDDNGDMTVDFGFSIPREGCSDGIDNDGDGLVDCADPDCGIVTITNVNVSNCIDHPYADVATLEITITWQTNPTEDTIEISILGKTEYINTSTISSPSTVNFLVPTDGVTNNTITVKFKEALCSDSDTYNAPFACSSNELRCNTLFICGDSKGADADAFDHGLMKYIDGINGNAILVGALAKNEAGLGLYDPIDGTTPLILDIDTFDLILVSATTWGDISNNLKFVLDSTLANVLLMNHDILTDLSMSTGGWTIQTDSAYIDDVNRIRVYNFNNTNPRWDPIIGVGSYYSDREDAYLWLNENDKSNDWNGIFFHYEASDTLNNVPSNHGSRTFLGYMMDGVYWNLSTNMGGTPVPEAEWFDPIRHLTLEGKYYLDQAISLAAINCTPEICDNGIDDDGDGVTDCFDSDCIPEANPTLLTTCDNSNGTGTGVFILHDANPTVSIESGVDISYHPTLFDVQNNINVLISPHASVNATIYARVQRGTTGCFNTSVVTLNVGTICIENCTNGIDDDGNGLVDCADSECPCCESDPPTLIKIIKKDP